MLPYYESDDTGDLPVKVSGLRTGKWKLVYATYEKDGKQVRIAELYNIEKDPFEIFNVMKENPETFGILMNEMSGMIRTYSAGDVPKDNSLEMDRETREKLKSLGYLK